MSPPSISTAKKNKGKLATASVSDVGQVRTNNEDAVGVSLDGRLLVLADGMGGYKAGEVASGMTVASVTESVSAKLPTLSKSRLAKEAEHEPYSAEAMLLRESLELAHTAVYQVSRTQVQCEGMGTTAVVALFHNDVLAVAYVGDSRLYRLRAGALEQITRDHSLVQELIDRGFYSKDEAAQKVGKNIVTRALGVEADVDIDLIEEPVEVDDIFLLCSDGLTDLVPDHDIAVTINQFVDDLDTAAQRLVTMANAAGGKDNISIVLARVLAPLGTKKSLFGRFLQWF